MLCPRSIVSLAALSIAGSSLTACGSSEFTCDESRTCPSANEPDGASGSAGSSGTGGTAGSGGSAGSAGSAGDGGSAGSAGSGGSAGEDGGAGSAGTGASDAGPDADSGACAVGTEGCACTAAPGCNTGLLCKVGICVKPVCGDSRVEGNEFCDDGQNLGTAPGECAPDCSVLVVQRKIVLVVATVLPNFARNGGDLVVQNADAHCPVGYKALFADGLKRVATITPNKGDGRKDWVLRPWTRYVNQAGAPIWTTNESALLGVTDGKFQGLINAVAPDDLLNYAVTGMNADWTILRAGDNCANWTTLTDQYLQIGMPWKRTTPGFLQADDRTPYKCDPRPVLPAWSMYCVEQ
jgi:hypothetical protein